MGKEFIFDLDDTLIPTEGHYLCAQKEFLDFVLDSFKSVRLSPEKIHNMHSTRQLDLVKRVGFNTEVFPQALKYTYAKIAEGFGINSNESIAGAQHAYRIGKSVFDEKKWLSAGLYPGVEDVLNFLASRGSDLSMITLGDSRMQRKKVKVMGLEKWFSEDNIYVDLREKGSKIRDISSGKDKNEMWFVGNSFNSDIRPALKEGIGAIYIPQNTWAYDGNPNEDHKRIIQLKKISDLKNIYSSLSTIN